MQKEKEKLKMEIHDVNIPEMEKQRYESIKNSDSYIELKIIIGTENEISKNGHESRTPVVITSMNHCGPKEIAYLYVTLQSVLESLEHNYPAECFIGKIGMEPTNMGTVRFKDENEEE